ncbi:MAG: hypothetical protein ACOVNZ_10135, partial [Crocinitomicaceae bacterium]
MKLNISFFAGSILISLLSFGQSIGIIGSFNSWTTDVVMSTTDNINFSLNYSFATNEQVKFRQDGAWAINWGASSFPSGTGTQDGPNVPVPAGNYDISFNIQSGSYLFQSTDTTTPPGYINPTN